MQLQTTNISLVFSYGSFTSSVKQINQTHILIQKPYADRRWNFTRIIGEELIPIKPQPFYYLPPICLLVLFLFFMIISIRGYCYFKLRKVFLKFYRKHSALVEKYKVNLKTLLQQGISELVVYADLVYRFRKLKI